MIKIKLTSGQVSALQCRDGGGLDPLTDAAWKRGYTLAFRAEDRDALADELLEACNAEDAHAEYHAETAEERRLARGACVALGNLSSKVRAS